MIYLSIIMNNIFESSLIFNLKKIIKNNKFLEEFLELLTNFYQETRFKTFKSLHQKFYQVLMNVIH